MNSIYLADEAIAQAWAQRLAPALPRQGFVSLVGPLGAGKSHFARSVIGALGYQGRVPSPTYTLVEHYASVDVYHLDLYRLGDPEELEFLNVREAIEGDTLCLIEWAERGQAWLPEPALEVAFDYQGDGRSVRLDSADQDCLDALRLLA